ncbi:MAG: sigma-54-dependent transcriptional regulator [bacterium]
MGTILIVEDDPHLRKSFEKILSEEGHVVYTTSTGEEGITFMEKYTPDLIIMDLCLPGINGLEAFRAMRNIDSKAPVIILTAFGTTETAIEATKLGAFDYILKPFEIPHMLSLINQAIEASRFMRSKVEINGLPESAVSEALIGKHGSMQDLYKAIGRVAPTDTHILIRGESGTGKGLVARAIYQHSQRADKPFAVINCVAIPEASLENELFGYEKGAFKGAFSSRLGKVDQANGGTLFLDEIGELPLNIQAKILRLLQERSFERSGGSQPFSVDVRIIASTSRDLEAALEKGSFREDLYYRLKVITLWLPPLREHLSDVPLLAEYFLASLAKEMKIAACGIAEEAKDILKGYHWPGNVRELKNIIQKSLIFNPSGSISAEEISTAIHGKGARKDTRDLPIDDKIRQLIRKMIISGGEENIFEHCMDYFASILIQEVLAVTGGNRTNAAKLLGLSRPTLQSKIEKYKIRIETTVRNG